MSNHIKECQHCCEFINAKADFCPHCKNRIYNKLELETSSLNYHLTWLIGFLPVLLLPALTYAFLTDDIGYFRQIFFRSFLICFAYFLFVIGASMELNKRRNRHAVREKGKTKKEKPILRMVKENQALKERINSISMKSFLGGIFISLILIIAAITNPTREGLEAYIQDKNIIEPIEEIRFENNTTFSYAICVTEKEYIEVFGIFNRYILNKKYSRKSEADIASISKTSFINKLKNALK